MAFPFSSLIRLGVRLADTFTENGQTTISHEAWIGQDKFGTKRYAPATHPRCVVTQKLRTVVGSNGQIKMSAATMTFTTLPPANGTITDSITGVALNRQEPIDPADRITLSNGFTSPIVFIGGPEDPTTGQGYILSVMLGAR